MAKNTNWVEIMEQNRDSIEKTIREAKKETYGTMQGWHVDVEINEKGESWTTELFSSGSQTMSSWNGETFIVCSIQSWDIDSEEMDLKQELKYHDNKKYITEYEAQDEYSTPHEFMSELYPEVLKEIEDEWIINAKDYELNEFDPSEILDRAIQEEELSA